MSIFGNRTNTARRTKKMSQTDLAKACATSPSRICNLEAGRNSPSLDMAVKIADALSVSLDYLTGRADGDEDMQRRAAILAQIEDLKAQL